MKLLSVAIPCYNSEGYMRHCIESLLEGGEQVEILIIDDGSKKDRTAQIADEYEKAYPGICRAIHQQNAGHGGAKMPRGFSLRWWTATTGWIRTPTCRFCGS